MRMPFRILSKIYFNLSLRSKFILPTVAVIFISFLSVGIYLIHDLRDKQEARLKEKAERISYLLLSSNVESIWDVDLKNLERNCRAFFEDEEITRIVIIDTFYGDEKLINLSKEISGTRDIIKTADFIKGDKKVAKLEVVFSTYYIEQHLAQLRNTLAFLSVLMFFLMAGLINIVSSIALKPLRGLMKGVEHLTAGDLKFRIPLQSQDEHGKLAVSFNTMAEELSLFHGRLQELVKQRTDELEKANEQLRREIIERERAETLLLQAKEAAEEANHAKSEFLANMSHELRTPLNAILGFSELMGRDSGLTDEQQVNLETIGRSGEHLLSLINDVLEFSKIEAGRIVLNPENFDLHLQLFNLEEMFRLPAMQKGLSLNFIRGMDVPQHIRTDQSKLRQILINLIGNAVKFTESGGITVSVTKKEPSTPMQRGRCLLYFEVIDTGVGIFPEEQSKIFDTFFQSDDPRLSQQGTGLGLPISQKFVYLLGGALTVDSKVGRGTRFSFELPVDIADGADIESFQHRRRVMALAEGQPVFRLLVAEDNDNNRKLLVKLLQAAGFEVKEAVNGRDTVEIWKVWRPHLIWMDMRMPVMDGYQATKQIKKSPNGNETVIIALTASAFEDDRLKVIEHGCNDFVRKPFRESEIFEMIKKHLGVDYLYDEDDRDTSAEREKTTMSKGDMFASINALPEEVIEKLKEACELSDAVIIDKVIEDLRTEDVPLADAFSELAANFAYDKILSLVQKANE